ncbi:LOW QUALITY PROTEIN: complement C1q-like protein 2 [Xiphophorus hellerii]|uniref:LOW QUALITY PROTEIN: complement C1q-like protein 2 n=1 Tax=Xiphophorus hellerii TaxID=8084 RepID=UPI0013B47714|nr:LOW QUALITY PROTEIN: complement C1q-like protein 2 [Xiphophorus hellerii]
MKKVIVLMLTFSLCHSGPGNDDDICPIGGSASCCNICPTNMEQRITSLETRLENAEKEVQELRRLTQVTPCQVSNLLFLIFSGIPRVAFSAALPGSGNTGPFTTATPLRYKKVFSNTGNCYNPSTGIFTATVSGMYFFRFSMFNNMTPAPNSVVSLMKNSERLTSVWDTAATDIHDSGSNAVVISLKVGDNVYVQLEPNRAVYDDGMHYNTFSGFLLFPM